MKPEVLNSTMMPASGGGWVDLDDEKDEPAPSLNGGGVVGTTNHISINLAPRLGWECPRCKACLSPDVSMCSRCAPPYCAPAPYGGTITYPPYTPTPTAVPWTWPGDGTWGSSTITVNK